MLEKTEVNKRNRKNQVDITKRRVFDSKMMKNTKLEMRKETKKRKEREDTKQFEPGGKWNRKNMCSKIEDFFPKKKNKRKREKHRTK